MRSQSRHSERTVRTKRSATAWPSCADWRAQNPDALAAEDLVERAGVLAVAVADQEADLLLGEEEAEVARLLGNPAAVRVGGTAAKLNTATAVLDEEENVEAT